eukprot:gnl/Chilomastix_cuspidata/2581.p1 GENE.gnl/Chilomastix_cuspidata/2581~~gnl/Chilomastix_cuspidata/2581.p1  ORF type:complete len:590 (+),score=190.26 gnl/Chilomastix_cuspidata/2581:524-2293(+)
MCWRLLYVRSHRISSRMRRPEIIMSIVIGIVFLISSSASGASAGSASAPCGQGGSGSMLCLAAFSVRTERSCCALHRHTHPEPAHTGMRLLVGVVAPPWLLCQHRRWYGCDKCGRSARLVWTRFPDVTLIEMAFSVSYESGAGDEVAAEVQGATALFGSRKPAGLKAGETFVAVKHPAVRAMRQFSVELLEDAFRVKNLNGRELCVEIAGETTTLDTKGATHETSRVALIVRLDALEVRVAPAADAERTTDSGAVKRRPLTEPEATPTAPTKPAAPAAAGSAADEPVPEESSEDPDELARIEAAINAESDDADAPEEDAGARVLVWLTGFDAEEELRLHSAIETLRGEVVEIGPEIPDLMVARRFLCTPKALICINCGVPILRREYLRECSRQSCFIETEEFVIAAPERIPEHVSQILEAEGGESFKLRMGPADPPVFAAYRGVILTPRGVIAKLGKRVAASKAPQIAQKCLDISWILACVGVPMCLVFDPKVRGLTVDLPEELHDGWTMPALAEGATLAERAADAFSRLPATGEHIAVICHPDEAALFRTAADEKGAAAQLRLLRKDWLVGSTLLQRDLAARYAHAPE